MRIGILALAAGRAQRFGADKRFAGLEGGRTVLDTFLSGAQASGLPLLLCLGEGDVALGAELRSRNIPFLLCRRSAEGMGGTLAEGVAAIPGWDGALVALADMPWVRPATYRLLAEYLAPGKICVPVFRGMRGHPVGFASSFFREMAALGGDVGARSVLAGHSGSVEELAVDDPAVLLDIDHPADLGAVSITADT